jgi:hypothetical protein
VRGVPPIVPDDARRRPRHVARSDIRRGQDALLRDPAFACPNSVQRSKIQHDDRTRERRLQPLRLGLEPANARKEEGKGLQRLEGLKRRLDVQRRTRGSASLVEYFSPIIFTSFSVFRAPIQEAKAGAFAYAYGRRRIAQERVPLLVLGQNR